MQIIVLMIILCSGCFIYKGQRTTAVLLISGLLLLGLAFAGNMLLSTAGEAKPEIAAWTNAAWLLHHPALKKMVSLVLIVMLIGGYSGYMVHVGAANAIVNLTTKPLARLHHPYLVLSFTYLAGQTLNVFIPSAAGLAMLLMVALYPSLVRIGISPGGAAAVIGTTGCLDLGPLSVTSIVAASSANLSIVAYFINHQLPVAILTALTIAALHYPVQKYFDSRTTAAPGRHNSHDRQAGDATAAPAFYALFPVLPLLFLMICNDLFLTRCRLSVTATVIISTSMVFIVEVLRKKTIRDAVMGLHYFLLGIWQMLRTVVVLIFAAEIFASGLWATGFLRSITDLSHTTGSPSSFLLILLILITGVVTLLSGSGSGTFISLSSFAAKLDPSLEFCAVDLILPMQFASSMFRSLSPVAGVIIVVAINAGLQPFDIVKRTCLPIAGGMAVMLAYSSLIS